MNAARIHLMRLVCALILCGAALQAQTIEGSVVNTTTGAGVPGALIRIYRMMPSPPGSSPSGQDPAQDAVTDAAGSFRFTSLKDGGYMLGCMKEGFEPIPGRTINIKGGTDATPVRFQLNPLARIAGRVIDGNRRPIEEAKVMLLAAGARELATDTDSDGAFAFERLTSGKYSLSARAPRDYDPPEPVRGQELGWAVTYYPGVTQREAAGPVVVSGSDIENLEMKLLTAPVYHVRGTVVDPQGEPFPNADMRIADAAEKMLIGETVQADDDGKFDLPVLEGSWRLAASAKQEDIPLEAIKILEVSRRDPENLELRLTPAFDMQGAVAFDPPLPAEDSTMIERRRQPPRIVLAAPGRVTTEVNAGEDGRFVLDKIFPGIYKLSVAYGMYSTVSSIGRAAPDPSAAYYLASLRVGGQDALGREMEISAGQTVEIRFEAHGGRIRGTVADAATGAQIYLQPQEPWLASLGRLAVSSDGKFEFTNIRPGAYFIVAVQRDVPRGSVVFTTGSINQPLDPATIARATSIIVRPEEVTTVELRAK